MHTTIPTYEALYVEYTQDILRLNELLQSATDPKHIRSIRKDIKQSKQMLEHVIAHAEAAGEPVV